MLSYYKWGNARSQIQHKAALLNHEPIDPNGGSMWTPFMIFAIDAASNGKSLDQTISGVTQFMAWCEGRDIPVKELVGCYKGQHEPAFIMSKQDFRAHNVAATWCQGQDSILLLGPVNAPTMPNAGFRDATLIMMEEGQQKREVPLGRWHTATESDALQRDCWTYEPSVPALRAIGLTGKAAGLYWVAGEINA